MSSKTEVVTFFNNKGGVGKTTLACNYASYLSKRLEQKVLFLDLDPQANATQLLLTDSMWEKLYDDRDASVALSVYKLFTQIVAGRSIVNTDIKLHKIKNFGIDLAAGHPRLSFVEDSLSEAWGVLSQGRPGGLEISNWLNKFKSSEFVKSRGYDYIVIDLGPSLGALNRSVLIGTDYYVTPVSADLFSLYALENIGNWLEDWLVKYQENYDRALNAYLDDDKPEYVQRQLAVEKGYCGYTVQQYVSKSKNGNKKIKAYEYYANRIPDSLNKLRELSSLESEDLSIGTVPSMFSMIPLAQAVHKPLIEMSSKDNVRGAQVYQLEKYKEQLEKIFLKLSENIVASGSPKND